MIHDPPTASTRSMRLKKAANLLLANTPLSWCLRFLLLIAVFALLHSWSWFRVVVEDPLILMNAWLTRLTLTALGVPTRPDGALIASQGFTIEIVTACTGLYSFMLLLSAVLSLPTGWVPKAKGILLGALLIVVLNHVRIVSLFFVGRDFPHLLDDLHHYVWPGVIIVTVAFYFYTWAVRSTAEAQP